MNTEDDQLSKAERERDRPDWMTWYTPATCWRRGRNKLHLGHRPSPVRLLRKIHDQIFASSQYSWQSMMCNSSVTKQYYNSRLMQNELGQYKPLLRLYSGSGSRSECGSWSRSRSPPKSNHLVVGPFYPSKKFHKCFIALYCLIFFIVLNLALRCNILINVLLFSVLSKSVETF